MKILGMVCLLLVGCSEPNKCNDKLYTLRYNEIYTINNGFYATENRAAVLTARTSYYMYTAELYSLRPNNVYEREGVISIDGRNLFQECVGE